MPEKIMLLIELYQLCHSLLCCSGTLNHYKGRKKSKTIKYPAGEAGPESLKDYFQKGALLGQKAAQNLWYVDTWPNSKKPFPSICRSVIYGLQNFKKQLMFSYIFIHIIQLSLFRSEYLPKAGKKVKILYIKGQFELCE